MQVARTAPLLLIIAAFSACTPAFRVEDVSPEGADLAPLPPSEVLFYNSVESVPFAYTKLLIITPRQRWVETDPKSLRPFVKLAADHGASGLIFDGASHRPLFFAVALDTSKRRREMQSPGPALPRVVIGATAAEVQTSWGPPDSINRTTTAAGVTEQWVYGGGRYVYLTNGRVTAIQEFR
jgi:hypothetical protein